MSAINFRPLCKACEQIERNERKNVDRPRAIIERRAEARAARLGVTKQFMWMNMNWAGLVPVMRAMLTPEGRCLSCGHPFVNERDIQIDHIEPPRHDWDWAREHARNLTLACQSCNGTKRDKPYAVYLDEQEAARVSNDRHRTVLEPVGVTETEPAAQWLFSECQTA